MKTALIFLLVLAQTCLFAQNWRNICTPGRTFLVTDSGKMAGFRLDSTVASGNGDTAYYSYKIFRGPKGVCLDSLHGSVLGNKVIGKSDGRFCFFNSSNDSVWINTQAKLNDSWIFCQPAGGSIITATVQQVKTDTVLGLPDSVKLISLSSSKYGMVKVISLSKHYGLIKMLDVYDIPSLTDIYTLAGKSSPALGFQQCLHGQEIFNFDAGDEFHYYHRKYLGYPRYLDTTEIRKVIAVSWAADSSSVNYVFSRCMHIVHFWEYSVDTVYTDTVDWHYRFSPSWESTMLMKMPGEQDGTWLHQLIYKNYNERTTSFSRYGEYWFITPDTCWKSGTSSGPIVKGNSLYAPGLGMTGFTSEGHSISLSESMYLKFYRKGNETWGTPVAVKCDSTGGIFNINGKISSAVTVTPNPASSQFTITVNVNRAVSKYLFSLADPLGHELRSGSFTGNSLTIERKGLPAGVYVIMVRESSGKSFPAVKVMLK